ncbi:MAG TPA: hypothetical protein ENH94_06990 [Phycisphaerales bacterium]|nr:hypothetical protein [Phycisphaerales bacterium]
MLLNNYKLRWCFLLWLVSNSACLYLHLRVGYYGMSCRDLVFLVLAIHGWRHWGNPIKLKGK